MATDPQPSGSAALSARRTGSRRQWTAQVVFIALFCIAVSSAIGIFGAMVLKNTRDPMFTGYIWLFGLSSCITSIPPILAGITCLVFSANKSMRVLRIARSLAIAGIVAMIAQSITGILCTMQAWQVGADTMRTSRLHVNWKVIDSVVVLSLIHI